jgi:diacylglycerol kinase family enzyme
MSQRPSATETGPPLARRRGWLRPELAAVVALVVLCVATVPLLAFAGDAVAVLTVLGCLFGATYYLWFFATRRGGVRYLGVLAAGLAVVGVVSVAHEQRIAVAAWLVGLVGFGVTAWAAVRSATVPSPGAAPPSRATPPVSGTTSARAVPPARHGVLVVDPLSGAGTAERLDLVGQARRRAVEPIVLRPGDDLRALVERAIRDGADVVGMAGGDGAQALVASVAMEHDVALVCVPGGTRNQFALDLGLEAGDVVGALDAFTDAVERRIDLASVDGHVFVNHASLGGYADVVWSGDPRTARLRTWRRRPGRDGPEAAVTGLSFDGPDGLERAGATLVVVSNNPCELAWVTVAGRRPRLDTGTLGLVTSQVRDPSAVARFRALSAVRQARRMPGVLRWSAAAFEVRATGTVPVCLDGETLDLTPPLRFTSLPGALRVRLPRHAPGIPPVRATLGFSRRDLERLVRAAAGRPADT